jgi:hypothetical protein
MNSEGNPVKIFSDILFPWNWVLLFSLFFDLTSQENNFLLLDRPAVVAFLLKAAGRTGFGAYTAIDASRWVTGPCGSLFIHRDALRWTFDGAGTAECADLDVVINLTPRIFKGGPDNVGIAPGGSLASEISHDDRRHLEHELIPPFTFPCN